MKSKLSLLIVLGLSLAVELPAQEVTAPTVAATESAGGPVAPAKPKPTFQLTTSKIYENGALYATLAKLNTGNEFIGLSVPERYRFMAGESGRDLTVYLDAGRQNWVNFQFVTNKFTEFTHADIYPLIQKNFVGLQPVFASGYAGGRSVLTFTAKSGVGENSRHIRYQVVPCESGTLIIGCKAYGNEGDMAFFAMKQLVGSLQFTATEKGLRVEEPSSQN